MAEKPGFIGLGNMGNRMSRHALKAGFSPVVYVANPAAIERLMQKAGEAASSPTDVARRAQKVCWPLSNAAIVEAVSD